ncbi:MAG: nitroreductase [Clostridia bacterium]|nr:nitroreductase [Clostridia bacterium]
MELIRQRRSVRTFDGKPLNVEDREKLLAYAEHIENPYGLPITWRILSAKEHGLSSPVISGTDTFIAGKLRRAPHGEEAFGFAFERFVLYAQSLSIGTTWIAGTMSRPAFEKAMELEGDEVMPCVSPLGYPAAKPSLRESLMRKGVKADSRMDFSALFFDGGFDRPLTQEAAGNLRHPLEMVRWAPSAVNKQPWRVVLSGSSAHFYEKRSKGYVDASGWDLQKVDVGIAVCHFVCGLEEQGLAWRLTTSDPGIAVPDGTEYVATIDLEQLSE